MAVLKSRPTILLAFLVALPAVVPSAAAGPVEQLKALIESELEDPPLPQTDLGIDEEELDPVEVVQRVLEIPGEVAPCVQEAIDLYLNEINTTVPSSPDELVSQTQQNAGRTLQFVGDIVECVPRAAEGICFSETTDPETAVLLPDLDDLPNRQIWTHAPYGLKFDRDGTPLYQLVGVKTDGNGLAECPEGWSTL